jgi:hypothetical protein
MQAQLQPKSSQLRWLAACVALAAALSLLAFPPARAAAAQLLRLFRVQNVVFMAISPEHLQQLRNLNFDKDSLFIAQPQLANKPAAPRAASSAAETQGLVGFTPGQISKFPSALTKTEHVVRDRSVYQFQVNLAGARQLLKLMNVTDVTLPDALGARPIVADVARTVETSYQGQNYRLELYQGPSPTVTVPDGVDLTQLGKAALRLIGIPPAQAETLSRRIDWSTTMIFPFPANTNEFRLVKVGQTDALLVGTAGYEWRLYWKNGDRFYLLEGTGQLRDHDIIAAAESVR